MLELLEAWVREGVTPAEMDFIKLYLSRSHAFDIDTATKRLHQALDVELLGLPKDYYTGYVEAVKRVTAESANRAVAERLHPEDLLIIVVGTSEEIGEDMTKAVPALARASVVPFDKE